MLRTPTPQPPPQSAGDGHEIKCRFQILCHNKVPSLQQQPRTCNESDKASSPSKDGAEHLELHRKGGDFRICRGLHDGNLLLPELQRRARDSWDVHKHSVHSVDNGRHAEAKTILLHKVELQRMLRVPSNDSGGSCPSSLVSCDGT